MPVPIEIQETPSLEKPSEPARLEIVPFAVGKDEVAALQDLASLPAWSAAIERDRFLARRGQSGPVHGTLVEGDDGLYLVDESTGDGALSIAVALPEGLTGTFPIRVILWGAWKPEKSPKWRWHASRAALLPAPSEVAPRVPRLSPIEGSQPADAVLASAVRNRGGTISFVVKERSSRAGDGWLIADDTGAAPAARLLLPGERESYGDQSELADDERWKLKENTRYWLAIRSFRSARPGEVPVYIARTAPHRDPEAPSAAPAKPSVP